MVIWMDFGGHRSKDWPLGSKYKIAVVSLIWTNYGLVMQCLHRSVILEDLFVEHGYMNCPLFKTFLLNEPQHDKTNKMTCVPTEDSDQSRHQPSLIRVFAVRSVGSWGPKVSSCRQQRLWSDWVDAQADLSLCWARMSFCWFYREQAQIIIIMRVLTTTSLPAPPLRTTTPSHWSVLPISGVDPASVRDKWYNCMIIHCSK